MKKKKLFVLIMTLAFFLPTSVNASSFNVSISCTSTRVGETSTCTIKGNTDSSAGVGGIKGNISVSGNATIEGSPIPQGWTPLDNSSSSFSYLANSGMTGSFNIATIKIKGNSEGQATITLSNLIMTDRSDYSEKSIGTKQATFSINPQTTKPTSPPTQPTKPTTNSTKKPNKVTSPTQPSTNRPDITSPTLSPLKLLSVTVDNFPVVYQNGAYYVNTESFTESVTINATAEEGVSIIGAGVRNLTYGKNVVELILKNASGQSNTYQVIITRPDDLNVHDTKLTNLKIVDYPFAFDPNQKEYTVKVPYNVDEIYVIAETLNNDVNIAGAGLKTLTKGQNKIYIKVSYGELQATDYVITIKRSYSLMILLISSGLLGAGLIAALVYAYINRKAVMEARNANKNRVIAEGVRQEVQASTPNVAVNGQNVIGEGRRTVVPTKVVSVKTSVHPVQTIVPTKVNSTNNDISNSAPDAQIRLVRKVPLDQIPTPQGIVNNLEENNNNNI